MWLQTVCTVSSCGLAPSLPSQTIFHLPGKREGLADVISIQEMLTNQILLFNFEAVVTPWFQHVRL